MTSLNDARLLDRIHRLPPEKQAEVVDFVEFLVARTDAVQGGAALPAIDDLVGNLGLQGDSVAVQRSLRDEWN